jgi:tetratricopeptide (TPR) repeat protein
MWTTLGYNVLVESASIRVNLSAQPGPITMNKTPDEWIDWVAEADRHLLGPEQASWLNELDAHRPVLEALLQEQLAGQDAERSMKLAGALARYWWMRGHTGSGLEWLRRALSLLGGTSPTRGVALMGAGSLAYAAGDFSQALRLGEEAILLLRPTAQQDDLARALDRTGMAARQLMQLDVAHSLHTEALEIQKRVGAASEQALCLNNLGVVAFFRGQLSAASNYHLEALALRRKCGDVRGQASSLNNLGQLARFGGDLASARTHTEQGLALRRQLGDRWGVAGSQVNLAAVLARLGDTAAAKTHLREALEGFQTVADPLGVCECLEAGAELAFAEHRLADALTFAAAAAQRRGRLPAPLAPVHRQALDQLLAEILSALGEEEYEQACRRGCQGGDDAVAWLASK